jgi:hypothetical protein
MTKDFEHAVRSSLGDIIAAAPEPDDQPMRLVTVGSESRMHRPYLAVAASLLVLAVVGGLVALGSNDDAGTTDGSIVTAVTDPPSTDSVETTPSVPTSVFPGEVRLRPDGLGPHTFGDPQSVVEATLTQMLGEPVVVVDSAPVFSCVRWGCSKSALLSWPTAGLFVAFSDRTVDGAALAEPVLAAWTITTATTWWPGDVHRPAPTSQDVVMPEESLTFDSGVRLGSTFGEVQSAFSSAVGSAWNASTFVPTGFFVPGADATTAVDGSLDWDVVSDLQSALVDDGTILQIDGVAGPDTIAALVAYQERTGLDVPAAFAALGVEPPLDAKVVRLSAGDWFWELDCGSLETFGVPGGC